MQTSNLIVHDLGAVLSELKQDVRTAKDLMQPWRRFHDDFAVRFAPIPPGEPSPNKDFDDLFARIGHKQFGGGHPVTEPMYLTIPQHNFWHGYCEVGPKVVIFCYFSDIGLGLAGYMDYLTSPEVALVRVTTIPVSKGPVGVKQ